MPGTEQSSVDKEVSKMLFLPSVSFVSGGGGNREMVRIQGAECSAIGKLRELSEQGGWAGSGRMRPQLPGEKNERSTKWRK